MDGEDIFGGISFSEEQQTAIENNNNFHLLNFEGFEYENGNPAMRVQSKLFIGFIVWQFFRFRLFWFMLLKNS